MNVGEISRLVSGTINGDAALDVTGVGSLESAGPTELTFAADSKALARAARSRAGCILIPEGSVLESRTTISVAAPKLAFIRVASALAPPVSPVPGIHPTAAVASLATLGADVSVGPHAVIEAGAHVGSRTSVGAGVFIGNNAAIGENCVLHARTVIYPGAQVRNRVILHAGVVIGGDGFGYVFAEGRHWKFPQLGEVVIEDDVEIGCNSTIDRGSLGATVIGEGTKIDNLVQIAHNVRVGRHCVIAAQTGISGSVEVGNYAVIGGQVGIGDHVVIEDGARVASKAGLPPGKIIRKGSTVWGIPARPLDVFKRQYAHIGRLPELARRVTELERRVGSRPSRPSKT